MCPRSCPRSCTEKLQTNLKPTIGGKYTMIPYIHPLWCLWGTPRGSKVTIFTEKNPLLGEKLVNGPGHLKDAQSATGPSSWMDNTDIMHFRPLFSLSRTPRLDLRKQHSVNLAFWHWRMAQILLQYSKKPPPQQTVQLTPSVWLVFNWFVSIFQPCIAMTGLE